MTRYTATIHHHSISSAPVENVGDTLAAAKRNATKHYGDGYAGHTIIIRDTQMAEHYNIVAERKIGGKWITHNDQ